MYFVVNEHDGHGQEIEGDVENGVVKHLGVVDSHATHALHVFMQRREKLLTLPRREVGPLREEDKVVLEKGRCKDSCYLA